jgi:hypothetical protein
VPVRGIDVLVRLRCRGRESDIGAGAGGFDTADPAGECVTVPRPIRPPAYTQRQTALGRGAVFQGVTGPPTGRPPASGGWHTENMSQEQQHNGGSELGRFLRARRAEVTPAEAGLTAGTGLRRTPGLRREELATLARVSVDYYTRLERGKETRPSPAVVDAPVRFGR